MSILAAALFRAVQAAPFYAELHREAVALLPDDKAGHWLDVGCGPGLLCRLAAEKGYRVTGADPDRAMIKAARSQRAQSSRIEYLQSGLGGLVAAGITADVVSASSLLAVLPDRTAGLNHLAKLVRPGGSLLIVEANECFGLRGAWRLRRESPLTSGHPLLLLWALVREGRTVPETVFARPTGPVVTLPLLGGMVTARRIGY